MNKFISKLLFSIFFLGLFAVFSTAVKAADYIITCSASTNSCSASGGTLFNETNIAPGYSVTKTFTADNTDNPDDCSLFMSAQNTTPSNQSASFSTRLVTVINDGASDLFGDGTGVNLKNFSDLFSQGNIFLGTVPAGDSKTYSWFVNFDKDANNDYQNNNLTFNFNLNFSCGSQPSPTLEPLTNSGGGGNAPVCNDTAPTSAPVLLSATANGANSVTLTWTPVQGPVSYYLVTYGTAPGVQTYGNPNVGGQGTTSYTVNGLSGGITYYFRVRAGNGCMPGPFSNELSVGATGQFLAGPAAGFAPGVLGVNTKSTPRPTASAAPQVLGTKCVKSVYPWWIFIVLEIIALLLILRRGIIDKWGTTKLILSLVAVGIVSQIIHEVVGCNCLVSSWCSKYIWINLVTLLLSAAYALYRFNKKNK